MAVMRISCLLFALLLVGPTSAQDKRAKCSVVLVDTQAAEVFYANPPADATLAQLETAAAKFVRILGEFQPEPGEEVLTTKAYSLPGTKLTVTASVYYTDESMVGDSMLLGLFVGARGVPNAITVEGGIAAETNLTPLTYIVRAKTRITIQSRPHALKLECQNMSMDDYGARLDELKASQKKPNH
jgi:hypothetical protein